MGLAEEDQYHQMRVEVEEMQEEMEGLRFRAWELAGEIQNLSQLRDGAPQPPKQPDGGVLAQPLQELVAPLTPDLDQPQPCQLAPGAPLALALAFQRGPWKLEAEFDGTSEGMGFFLVQVAELIQEWGPTFLDEASCVSYLGSQLKGPVAK